MKITVEAILDRLEPHFTKRAKRWRDRPPPGWLRLLLPGLDLKPTERHSLRLYLRQALAPALLLNALFVVMSALPLLYIWRHYPWFFHRAVWHRGLAHRVLVGLLAHAGYYQMPLALIFLLALNLVLHFPEHYFWNRRADRLRAEVPTQGTAAAVAPPADVSIWPPAPNRPAV